MEVRCADFEASLPRCRKRRREAAPSRRASPPPNTKHKTPTARAPPYTTNDGIARDAIAPRSRPRATPRSRRAARRADPPRVAPTRAPPQALATMEAPDDDLTTLARGNWILMQLKHGVTPDNFVTLEELQTSSPKTYARIFVELCESASEEDKLNLAKRRYAKLKKRKPNVKQGRSEAAKARDRENAKKWDARMREEEARRAAAAARIEALRQECIAKEAFAKAEEERREQEIEDRVERRKERAKIRALVLKGEDVPSKEQSRAEAKKKRPPPPPKRAPAPKRKAPALVPSRRRTGGAFTQARHAVDATSSLRLRLLDGVEVHARH